MNALKSHKIVIIEPSPVIQKGLTVLLEEHPEFVIQNTYSDFQHFQENETNDAPDLILINPTIINSYKPFSIKTLFEDYTRTVFVAIFYKYVNPEILAEFDSTLDIYDETLIIIDKLHEVLKVRHNRKKATDEDSPDLSEREKEILASVALGLTNKEIADKHYISSHTVVSHRKNITRKTGIKTVSGLTLYAMFNNLISQDDLK